VAERDVHSRPENRRENTMKKLFAALAVLGIVLGTATLITPAYAAYYSFEGSTNQGDYQGNNS
jgi:ABC-type lipoprotein release transport system permease subunit